MKILITGSNGFIGKNLVAQLKNTSRDTLLLCDRQTTPSQLSAYLKQCNFIIHLAGSNRPEKQTEFMAVHYDFTADMLEQLKQFDNHCPILAASSIHAALDTPYGKSKKAMEDILTAYGLETGAQILLYRLPNVFGKWCRPHYNSVIATFCYQIARNQEIQVNDENCLLRLVYIDDVVAAFLEATNDNPVPDNSGFSIIPTEFSVPLNDIVAKLYHFHDFKHTLKIASLKESFDKKLYGTYLSYLPPEQWKQELDIKIDNRGYFSELLKSDFSGQISVSRTKPGVIRGNHWHHTKTEKFIVIEGNARIRFRMIGGTDVIQYQVSGEKPELIEVPPGYTHSLENSGSTDMIALIWCNEQFLEEKPDTYYEEV